MLYYVDFKCVNVAAVASLPAILKRVLPGGRYESHRHEFMVRNPTRADTTPGSFKIRVSGHRAGAWADFATDDRGGDPVSLIAYLENVSQREAARLLAQMLGLDDRGHDA